MRPEELHNHLREIGAPLALPPPLCFTSMAVATIRKRQWSFLVDHATTFGIAWASDKARVLGWDDRLPPSPKEHISVARETPILTSVKRGTLDRFLLPPCVRCGDARGGFAGTCSCIDTPVLSDGYTANGRIYDKRLVGIALRTMMHYGEVVGLGEAAYKHGRALIMRTGECIGVVMECVPSRGLDPNLKHVTPDHFCITPILESDGA